MSNNVRDLVHKTLMQEHERLSADIRLIETQSDKILGFGLTIVGIGLTYGIEKGLTEILVLLPIALLGIYVYAARRADQLFWLGGYKRAVEEKVNELAGYQVLHWETLVETKRGRLNHGEVGLTVVYSVVLIASILFSGFKMLEKSSVISSGFNVLEKYGPVALVAFFTLICFFLILIFLAVRAMPLAYSQALDFGRKEIQYPFPSNRPRRTPKNRTSLRNTD